jgi:hypothetical protein
MLDKVRKIASNIGIKKNTNIPQLVSESHLLNKASSLGIGTIL